MFLFIIGMRPDEDISRVRVAVYKARNKNLFSKCSNEMVHYLFFVKVEMLHLILIGDLESIDPLGNHHSLSTVFL